MASRSPFSAIKLAVVAVAGIVTLTQTYGHYWFRKPIVPGQVEVFFSPKGGCTQAVVDALQSARVSVLVQAYSFTSTPIAKALVDARKRGLDVQIIVDKSQQTEKYTEADFTSHAGIPTWIDSSHAIAHNKVMIIDEETIVTGSFNFTKAAEEHNAENLLILHKAPELARLYLNNWRAHLKHSQPYKGR